MVDLHCHILPGLDDGPATLEEAVALARVARAAGVDTVSATPHIRDDHPFPLELIQERLSTLRAALREAEIDLTVLASGEVAISKVADLDDEMLAALCIGDGRYLLVETPFTQATSLLETVLFDLQVRGFRPLLAHPERSITFLHDRARLESLVERGIGCSVTAMSIDGAFGRSVRDFTLGLFTAGLVHNVASDAHRAAGRAPGFARALTCLTTELEASAESAAWFTGDAARAIVAGRDIPAPPPLERHSSGWKRMKGRVGLA